MTRIKMMSKNIQTIDQRQPLTRGEVDAIFLSNRHVQLVFKKKDGSDRYMECTTLALPEDMLGKSQNTEYKPGDIKAVYDLVAKGWRSVNVTTISAYSTETYDYEVK